MTLSATIPSGPFAPALHRHSVSRRSDRLGSSRLGTSGVAALEFAFVTPMLLLICFGAIDVSRGWLAWRRVVQSAQSAAEIATALAVQADGSNSLTTAQAQTATGTIYVVYPSTQAAPASQFGVALSEVVFTSNPPGCTSGCNYTANVAWSAAVQGSATARSCGTLTSATDASQPSLTTLPSDAFSPASLIVVDVTYQYNPILLSFVTGPIAMHYAAYLPPRSGTVTQWTRYSNGGVGTNCAGWS